MQPRELVEAWVAAVLISAAANVGAFAAEGPPTPARLKRTEVVRIANSAAEIRGYRLNEYYPPRVLYEFTKRDRTWSLYYEGRAQKPGDHFWVWVQDESGLASVQAVRAQDARGQQRK